MGGKQWRGLSSAPRSAAVSEEGSAAGRGSGGGGSPAPRRRRSAAHASPRGGGSGLGRGRRWGRGRSLQRGGDVVGGAGGETRHFPTPPPRGAAAATEPLGLIQVRSRGRGRRGCLSCCLSCRCPCRRRSRGRGPHPTPPPSGGGGGGGGQNEASCGLRHAAVRALVPPPAPEAWQLRPRFAPPSAALGAASLPADSSGSVPDSETFEVSSPRPLSLPACLGSYLCAVLSRVFSPPSAR